MKQKAALFITLMLFFSVFSLLSAEEYVVQRGDTIYSICRRFDVDPDYLMEVNHISNPSLLRVGQKLKIPNTYEVQPGDTYYGIARKFSITVAELLAVNDRTESSLLLVGDTLQLPVKSTAVAAGGAGSGSGGNSQSGRQNTPGETGQTSSSSGNTGSRQGDSFWPHTGERSQISGKLTGAQFNGKQGDSIVSVSSGRVIWVAPYRGYNKLIIVEAPDSHLYAYGGNDVTLVSVGDAVRPGMEIGKLGVNPHEGMAKAFFFVYKNGNPIDPEKAPRV